MRETVGIPAGILIYFISTIVSLIIVQIIFADPHEWASLITASVAVLSFQITCAAVQNFSTEDGVKIVGVIIAMFWLISLGVDVFGGAEEMLTFLSGGYEFKGLNDFKELAEAVWNSKICAGVSVVLALWTLGK